MMKSIQFLGNSVMSIDLLAQSGCGKAVEKFIKECRKVVATTDCSSMDARYSGPETKFTFAITS